ncbi:DUF2254 domain-containing protein [Brumimicrobium aurantiacum]|uniref:DUF2254 domain-containing protein n=1 Tax=Brumimicrobium aurantiacum TaxID=1737063 RepID=A0A3E1EZZ7_9FLAO|nr:DUF2254 domain-containing protein [Brumimicrobium aurantiacum]RFC55134.1 DUF2254 domain-containing protein [Brumimicrobium aurantiacum]
MLKKTIKFLKQKYIVITQSIAFFPVLISLIFFILAIISINVENTEFINSIKEKVPYLFIKDYETARAILSTIIGGILSLTVFSFSMVMVVLNQASSSFSPRLLPSLVSNVRHQIILGFYIGTLLFCIISFTALGAYGVDADSLGLSTMLAAIASLICIGLFVYFINSISVAIQIHNIIDKIYDGTKCFLDAELKKQKENKIVTNTQNSEDWTTIKIDRTGYYRSFDVSLLTKSIREKGNHIIILPYVNQHIWKGMPVLKVKNFIDEDELENLLFCFDISPDRHAGENNETGLIKLMEVAVKAMSPGINDPGTAINAINKIGQLLNLYLEFPESNSRYVINDKITITDFKITAKEMMRMIIQPIRLYAKHDNSVMYVLIKSLQFICENPNISELNKSTIKKELDAIKEDIDKNVENSYDKQALIDVL